MMPQDEFKPKKNLKIENWQKWGFWAITGIAVHCACFSMDLVLRYRVFKPMFMSAGFIYVLLAKTTPLDLLYTPHHGVAQLCHLIFF